VRLAFVDDEHVADHKAVADGYTNLPVDHVHRGDVD
jgi:hypothetical protein